MRLSRGRRIARVLGALAAAGIVLGAASSALAPAWAADGDDAPTVTSPSGSGLQATVDDVAVKVGDEVTVRGSGWPANTTVSITTCGNYALNLSADCDQTSQVSAAVAPDGTFGTKATVGRPPTQCPCVLRVVNQQTNVSKIILIGIDGIPTGEPTQVDTTRSLTATARITGWGPASSLLGGGAKRTLELTVTNTGAVPLQDPAVTIFAGKGSKPTRAIAQPKLGTIAPKSAVVYKQPFTISPTEIGTFQVRAVFTDVNPIVDVSATTSTYPWLLFLILILLLQIPLLGLYKKRPVIAEPGVEDPVYGGALSGATAAVNGAHWANGADSAHWANGADSVANGLNGYGAVGAVTTAVVPRPASVVDPYYRPVFGVSDLRAYLAPGAESHSVTVAPRIVIGGVVPTTTPAVMDPYVDQNAGPA